MKKCIGIFSLVIGLYGTFIVLCRVFLPDLISQWRWLYFTAANFSYSFPEGLEWVVECVFHLMLLTGSVIYLQKLADRSGLLRFCYSVIFFGALIGLLWRVLAAKVNLSHLPGQALQYWLWALYPATLLLVSYWAVKFMNKEFVVIESTADDGNIVRRPATKNYRLLHLIFDFMIVLGFIGPLAGIFDMWTRGKHFDYQSMNRYVFIFIIGCHRFLYYGLLESIFKVTPVKFLTGTYVANEFGPGIPSPARFWGRTCFRFIPFEPFSFLGTRGWHDSLSQSVVVKEKRIRPGRPYAGIWISLLLILPLGKAGLDYYRDYQRDALRNKYYDEANQLSKESIIRNLSTDDLIVYRSPLYSKKQVRRIFKVEQVDPDTLWGYTCNMDEGRVDFKNVIAAYQKSTLGDTLKSIPKKNLEMMILENKNGDLFGDGQQYDNDISIFSLHQPVIKMGSSNTQKRTGEPAKANWTILVENKMISLKSITTQEGDILWKTTLPLEINGSQDKGFFKVTAENFEDTKRHQSLFVFEDDEGRQFEYIGFGMGRELQLFRK